MASLRLRGENCIALAKDVLQNGFEPADTRRLIHCSGELGKELKCLYKQFESVKPRFVEERKKLEGEAGQLSKKEVSLNGKMLALKEESDKLTRVEREFGEAKDRRDRADGGLYRMFRIGKEPEEVKLLRAECERLDNVVSNLQKDVTDMERQITCTISCRTKASKLKTIEDFYCSLDCVATVLMHICDVKVDSQTVAVSTLIDYAEKGIDLTVLLPAHCGLLAIWQALAPVHQSLVQLCEEMHILQEFRCTECQLKNMIELPYVLEDGETLCHKCYSLCSDFVEVQPNDIECRLSIGEGQSGTVYKAKWKSKQIDIVLKRSEQKELQIIQGLRHPNILKYYGTLTEQCTNWIISEKGTKSLFEHFKSSDPDMSRSLSWAVQVAKGMEYLHSKEPCIIHGDLKSPNVILFGNDVVKVCDFGSAKCFENTSKTTTLASTIQWAAPEILNSRCKPTLMSDVYSYGVLLWELVTHKQPFGDDNIFLIPQRVLNNERPAIPQDCWSEFSDLMPRCWAQESTSRPSFKDIVHWYTESEKLQGDSKEVKFDSCYAASALSIFQVYFHEMSTVLHPDEFGSRLYAAALISDEEKAGASIPSHMTEKQRMGKLLEAVQKAIRIDNRNFRKFWLIMCTVEKYKSLAVKMCPKSPYYM